MPNTPPNITVTAPTGSETDHAAGTGDYPSWTQRVERFTTSPQNGVILADRLPAGWADTPVVANDPAVPCQAGLQRALDALGTLPAPGMLNQSSSGTFRAGTTALPGGGRVILGHGVYHGITTLKPKHRGVLQGQGSGTVLRSAAGQTGAMWEPQYDSSLHAQYTEIADLTLDGGWKRGQATSARDGIVLPGDETSTYNSPLDEDYDSNHRVRNVYIVGMPQDGLRAGRTSPASSGEATLIGIKVRDVGRDGISLGQDNQLVQWSAGWCGRNGLRVMGDSCTIGTGKAWYSDQHNIYSEADTGIMVGVTSQDAGWAGAYFKDAFGWRIDLAADHNGRITSGWPGLVWENGGQSLVTLVARNRYNAGSATGRQPYAVRLLGSITNLDVRALAATGVWGTLPGLDPAGGGLTTVPSGSRVTVNGA